MNEQIGHGAPKEAAQTIAKRGDALYNPDHTGRLQRDASAGERVLQAQETACRKQAQAEGGANRTQGALKPGSWIERMAGTILFWTSWHLQAYNLSKEIVQVLLVFEELDQHTTCEPIHLDLHYPGSAGQTFYHELGQLRVMV
jgi:hypothetical protein